MIKRLLLTVCASSACLAVAAHAFTPIKVNGAVSYNHRLAKSGGAENTSQYLQGDIGFRSFVWQPWFILWSADLSLAFTDAEGGSYTSESTVWSGDLGVDVFSRSRFPFTLNLSRYDSQISNFDEHSLVDFNTDSTSTKLRMKQSYSALSGSYYNAWYNVAEWESASISKVRTDNFGVAAAMRFTHQTLQMNLNLLESDSGGEQTTDTTSFTVNHAFSPGSDFSVNSAFALTSDEATAPSAIPADPPDTFTDDEMSASSSFYWRPEYSDLSMNGAVRFKHSESSSNVFSEEVSRDLNGSIGVNYSLTRKIRLFGNVSAGFAEEEGDKTTATSTQVLGGSFNSDSYYFGKTIWRWNSTLSGSNSIVRGGGDRDTSQAVNFGLGHMLTRSWLLTRTARTSAMFGQSAAVAKTSSADELGKSIGNNARLTFTQGGRYGSTNAWLSVQDNRSIGSDSSQQQATAQISRNQSMSRVSSLNGNLSYNWSRQTQSDTLTGGDESTISRGGAGSMSYINSRIFGVYRLQFNSLLTLQEASAFAGEKVIASKWDNNLSYNIGLLSVGLSYNFIKQEGRSTFINRLFRVTRRF